MAGLGPAGAGSSLGVDSRLLIRRGSPLDSPIMLLRPVLAALVAPLVGLAAGCSTSGDRPQPIAALSSAASSPSAVAQPSSSPSVMPKETPPGPTPASAAAFVRAYYAAVNKASLAGTDRNVRQFVDASCRICAETLSYLQYLRQNGLRNTAPPLALLTATAQAPEHGLTVVSASLRTLAGSEINFAGRAVRHFRGKPTFSEGISLNWRKGRWVITNISEYR